MPDLISHIATGYLTGARYRSRTEMAIFLLGTILPDMLTRPWYILWPQLYWHVYPLHTPVGIVFSCLLLSGLFAREWRNRVFLILLAGSILHLFLDLFQRHRHGGYALLFPVSWRTDDFGLLWPEQTLLLLPAWITIMAFVIVWRHRKVRS